jgi:hypothetical protein
MTAETINEYWTLIMFALCFSAFLVVVIVGAFVRAFSEAHRQTHAPNVPEGKSKIVISPNSGVYIRPTPAPPVPDDSEKGWAHKLGYYEGMSKDLEDTIKKQTV